MKKIILGVILLFLLCACSPKITKETSFPAEETSFLLNTVVTITIYDGENIDDPYQLIQKCFALCTQYENLFSRTIEESDVSKINKSNGQPVSVSEETAELIELALDYSVKSQGAFDITIASASTLWDFQTENPVPPLSEQLEEAASHIHYQAISLNGNQVTLSDPNASIDLGGIAKGYIADKAAAFLRENGVTSAILNLGGNIYVIGSRPDKKPFLIGIQKPFETRSEVMGAVSVSDKSIVTSGIYERFFRFNETLYHHILDPKTGWPIENNLLSVTIISDRSVDGDALSTTCFVLGLDQGMEFIESLDGIDAIFITKDNELHFSSGIGSRIPFEIQKTK